MRLPALLLALAVSYGGSALALDPAKPISEFIHDRWSVDEGLPQNSVLAMAQTADGFLWFATHEGVARFDGQSFFSYTEGNAPALVGGGVLSIVPAQGGGALLGLRDGDVVRYRAGRFEPLTQKPEGTARQVTALVETVDGVVWAGTAYGGLLRIAGGEVRIYTVLDGLPSNSIYALQASGDRLWIGTAAGLRVLSQGRIERLPDAGKLDWAPVSSLLLDAAGHGWVASNGQGLFSRSSGGTRQWTPADGLASTWVTRLLRDSGGGLWIGTAEGVQRLVGDRFETYSVAQGLTNSLVRDLLEDAEGNLWIGTNRGVDRLRDGRISMLGARSGLANEFIRTVVEDREGTLWVGTDDGLFRRTEAGFRRFGRQEGLASSSILAFMQASDGRYWIGTSGGGVHVMQRGRIAPAPAEIGLGTAPVRAIVETPNGSLWFASNVGLVRYDRDGTVRRYETGDGLPADQVISLLATRDGVLWVGTNSGAARVQDGRVKSVASSTRTFAVLSISVDAEGRLWFGTQRGLARLVGDTLTPAPERAGLPMRAYFSVMDDGSGALWLCSNQGIVRVTKARLLADASATTPSDGLTLYGRADGMATVQCNGSSQPTAMRHADGRIWFATAQGIAVVDPARQLARNLRPPPVQITQVVVDGVRQVPAADIILKPGGQRLDIGYVGVSMVTPERMTYRYMLDGLETEWTQAQGVRLATYSRIKPGSYTFRVQAANADGVWNEAGATLAVVQQPRLHERPAFYLAGLLLMLFLGAVFDLWRSRHLRERTRALQAEVAARTVALAAETERLRAANAENTLLLAQIRAQAEREARLAREDSLTGLPNRRELDSRLQVEFERAKRSGSALSVAMTDIDHFKRVNDEYSHAVGDQVLRAVAGILDGNRRASDLVARYGGEEFVLMLPDTTASEAHALCERMRRAVENFDWSAVRPGLALTLSFGIAEAGGAPGHERLLALADARLYTAKAEGRNRVAG
jgi:diguanylate cyclase (GGDEF)-like protein